MADRTTKTWREVRRQRALNESRVEAYKRLMDAEARLEHVRRRREITDEALGEAVEAAEAQPAEDLYLSALARYVDALGGHLEVRAVFPEETVMLLRDPTR